MDEVLLEDWRKRKKVATQVLPSKKHQGGSNSGLAGLDGDPAKCFSKLSVSSRLDYIDFHIP